MHLVNCYLQDQIACTMNKIMELILLKLKRNKQREQPQRRRGAGQWNNEINSYLENQDKAMIGELGNCLQRFTCTVQKVKEELRKQIIHYQSTNTRDRKACVRHLRMTIIEQYAAVGHSLSNTPFGRYAHLIKTDLLMIILLLEVPQGIDSQHLMEIMERVSQYEQRLTNSITQLLYYFRASLVKDIARN